MQTLTKCDFLTFESVDVNSVNSFHMVLFIILFKYFIK